MKVLLPLSFQLLLLLSLLSSSGCETDACETLDCQNGGECLDGACLCPPGIIGKECDIIIDPCLALECVNGTCIPLSETEAFCQCENGYEGDLCEKAWTSKFATGYDAVEVCNGNGLGFPVDVVVGPRFNQITIENFRNVGAKVVADLINARVVNIYEQPMTFGFVSGAGSMSLDEQELTLNFTIIDGKDTLMCTAILTK